VVASKRDAVMVADILPATYTPSPQHHHEVCSMVATRITVDEFEATCGDERVELIDGVIVPMTPASYEPSRVTMKIALRLGMHVLPRQLGDVLSAEAGFVLFPDRETVLAPDVAFVRAGREPQGEARWHFARLAPDLVVEVLSPSDRAQDMRAKVAMYQEAGVPLTWVVDPHMKTVAVLALGQPPVVLTAADMLDGGEVLPEFRVEVSELFA
jgi:Uma2 family endonuclease